MPGLTAEQIQALMQGRSRKGLYLAKLNEFVSSGEGGVCVHDEWPLEFADKNATATKQGFENAKNSKNAPAGSDGIIVINNDEKTFLINPAAAGVEAPAAEVEQETADVA